MHPTRSALFVCLPLAAMLAAGPLCAQTDALDPEVLVARERLRAQVEARLLRVQERITDADVGHMTFLDTAWGLAGLGPEAAPLLIEELEQEEVDTFVVVAYSLGLLSTPETEQALRRAMKRADKEKGSFAWARKGWAGTALSMQGVEDAVDLPLVGQRPAASFGVFRNTSLLEYAAVMSEPHGLGSLLEQFDSYEHEEATGERPLQLLFILRSLRWLGSPEAVPRVARALDHPRVTIRVEAATTLSAIDTPESLQLLLTALSAEDHLVRRSAARALEKLRPTGKLSVWKKRLELEDKPLTRGPLYRLVAQDAPAAGQQLKLYAWSEDGLDRLHLVRALGLADSEDVLPLLEQALSDRDLRVALNALMALRGMSTPGAGRMLRKGLDAPSPDVAIEAASYLALANDREAAPRIAELLRQELDPNRPRDPGRPHRIEVLGDALVRLDGTASDELRGRIAGFEDHASRKFLRGLQERLDALATHGADVDAWSAAAASPQTQIRLLAYRKLGEIGGEKAAAALVSAFGRVEPEEGGAILDALAGLDSDQAVSTIERVLVDPAFDHVHRRPLRHAAAWAARQKGLSDALLRAIERRDGRDVWPMIYLAALEGERALPVLAKYRRPRLRHLSPRRGNEQERLDWIAREIREGRSIGSLDVRPNDKIFTVPF